eukprot:17320-Pelagomonas_calceolata.AAC.1
MAFALASASSSISLCLFGKSVVFKSMIPGARDAATCDWKSSLCPTDVTGISLQQSLTVCLLFLTSSYCKPRPLVGNYAVVSARNFRGQGYMPHTWSRSVAFSMDGEGGGGVGQ